MWRRQLIVFVLTLTVLMPAAARSSTSEGAGRAKVGYVFFDPYGNRSLYQENYNVYEGGVVSLEDFWYTSDSGLRVTADLTNLTLENRNLRFSASKSKVFTFNFYNNKYKRIYDPDDLYAAKREMFGFRMSVTLMNHFKIYGGLDRTTRRGENYTAFDTTVDPEKVETDFRQRIITVGARGFHDLGSPLLEYRGTRFEDYIEGHNDREADAVRLAGTLPIPNYWRVVVSAGYNYRQDVVRGMDINLKTNMAWAGTKVYLPHAFLLDYRFVYGHTAHESPAKGSGDGSNEDEDEDEYEYGGHQGNDETNNMFNTIALSKSWKRHGGVRVGYDNRWADGQSKSTMSNGFLINGWYNYARRLFLKAAAGTRAENVTEGRTLIGDEDYTRYMVSARYVDDRFGDITARYRGRERKREDLGTHVDYDAFSTELGLERDSYGRFSLTYAYYIGKFTNRESDFEFSDHMVTARLTPVTYKRTGVSLGGTYFKSERDLSLEKYSWDIGLTYAFLDHYAVEGKYSRFDFRDFLMNTNGTFDSDYVEIYIVRDFTL
jgi:hypothetical protein